MQNTNVTIPDGGTLSEVIDCQEYVPVALVMPDDWDAASVTFQAVHQGPRPTNLRLHITTDATGGAFNVDVDGANDDIAFNASAAAFQTALEGLATVAVGDVAVTGSAGDWTVEFLGLLAGADAPTVVVDFTNLTGDTDNEAATVQSGSGLAWKNVYDADGNEVTATVAADRHVVMAPDGLRSARWLRLRSGTAGVPVAQSPARTIGVVLVTDTGS